MVGHEAKGKELARLLVIVKVRKAVVISGGTASMSMS
jgi:hypothetical protein